MQVAGIALLFALGSHTPLFPLAFEHLPFFSLFFFADFFPDLLAGKPHIISDPTGKDWLNRINAGEGAGVALEIISKFSQGKFPETMMYTPDSAPYNQAWRATIDAPEDFNALG